ncbi:PrsW family glutamic-type intramembrane protease [Candidatus Pelagibacter sp.]|jgi:RsiW-degrading membrane proteinase PrsW (M82 family)|nr:PrsW family glutamic-type intramembrane protease [Candidatus Pelagibacter sp.]
MPLLLITILPSILIIIFFVNSDRFREPTSEILKVFFYGILITIPAYFLNSFFASILYQTKLHHSLIGSFFTAAPIEEGLKLAVMYYLVFKMKDFNEPLDGIVYGVSVSLGFATLENFYYVYVLSDTFNTSAMSLAALRAFSAIPAHAVFGIFMGYFFMKYAFIKKGDNLIFAFVVPFALHGCYNLFVYSNFLVAIILIIISWIIGLRLFSKLKKGQGKKRKENEKKI